MALNDGAWLAPARDRLVADSARLDDLLRAAGFEILGGTLLFRLARHAAAPAFVQRLAREGIHVRAFAYAPDQSALRFAWQRRGVRPAGRCPRRLITLG